MLFFMLLIGSILVIDKFDIFFSTLGTTEEAYFWSPNTILMIMLSIAVFEFFVHLEVPHNNFINHLASTTLGIYLLHDGVLAYWLWQTAFQCAQYQNKVGDMIIHILGSAIIVFGIGVVIDLLRQILEKNIVVKILDLSLLKLSRITNGINL